MIKQTPEERINMLRRCLHLHSVIYYHMHTTIVTDATFDGWANELVVLQKKHPEFLHKGYMHTIFSNWTGDTGMHLPVTDDMYARAQWAVERATKTS